MHESSIPTQAVPMLSPWPAQAGQSMQAAFGPQNRWQSASFVHVTQDSSGLLTEQ